MSVGLACPAGPPALVSRIEYGRSEEALLVQRLVDIAVSPTLAVRRRQQTLDELQERVGEALFPGWDGHGAKPVDGSSYALAWVFLNRLPYDVGEPEVSIAPTGEVLLDWLGAPSLMFTVSLAASGRVSYAGIFENSGTMHGTEQFMDAVPKVVLDALSRLRSIRRRAFGPHAPTAR